MVALYAVCPIAYHADPVCPITYVCVCVSAGGWAVVRGPLELLEACPVGEPAGTHLPTYLPPPPVLDCQTVCVFIHHDTIPSGMICQQPTHTVAVCARLIVCGVMASLIPYLPYMYHCARRWQSEAESAAQRTYLRSCFPALVSNHHKGLQCHCTCRPASLE